MDQTGGDGQTNYKVNKSLNQKWPLSVTSETIIIIIIKKIDLRVSWI